MQRAAGTSRMVPDLQTAKEGSGTKGMQMLKAVCTSLFRIPKKCEYKFLVRLLNIHAAEHTKALDVDRGHIRLGGGLVGETAENADGADHHIHIGRN